MKKIIDPSNFEKADFSGLMQSKKGRKPISSVKRITMNITERIYEEASELDRYMGMGYQNVLKAAMTIGMGELYKDISSRRTISASAKK